MKLVNCICLIALPLLSIDAQYSGSFNKPVSDGTIEFTANDNVSAVYLIDSLGEKSIIYYNDDPNYNVFNIRFCQYEENKLSFIWSSNIGLEYILFQKLDNTWQTKNFTPLGMHSSTYSSAAQKYHYQLLDLYTVYVFKPNEPSSMLYYRFSEDGTRKTFKPTGQ